MAKFSVQMIVSMARIKEFLIQIIVRGADMGFPYYNNYFHGADKKKPRYSLVQMFVSMARIFKSLLKLYLHGADKNDIVEMIVSHGTDMKFLY